MVESDKQKRLKELEKNLHNISRRDFIIGGLVTVVTAYAVGDIVLGGPIGSSVRKAWPVQPQPTPSPTLSPSPSLSPTPKPSVEEIIREDLLKRVSKLNEYPDVKVTYPRQVARFVLGEYMGKGDIDFYKTDADIHARIVEKQIKLYERGKRGIPLKLSESGFSNLDIYHANLEESLITHRAYTHDLKKAKISYDLSIQGGFHETLAANVDNFDDISEEVGNEVEDVGTFNRLVDSYSESIRRGQPGLPNYPEKDILELDKRAKIKILKIKEVGTYGERLSMADRGYTREKYEHDLGRPIWKGRLWTRCMAGYEGIWTLPDPNPISSKYGEYIGDGFSAFPLTDATKDNTGATTEKTTQSWGYPIDDMIPIMRVVGKSVKAVSIGTSRGRSFFYGTHH